MTFRINVDLYQKKQRFNVTISVVCSHLILAYTVRLTIINAAELERNGWFFFTLIEEYCVVIKKNIDKKLANRISYQIRYKRCSKGKFGRGVQICGGGSISASGFDLDVVRRIPNGSTALFSVPIFTLHVFVH